MAGARDARTRAPRVRARLRARGDFWTKPWKIAAQLVRASQGAGLAGQDGAAAAEEQGAAPPAARAPGRAGAHALGGAAGAPLAGRSTNSSFRIAPACSRGEPGSIQELDYTSATREIGGAAV